jgi:L,D-peptidoglycan transpeptidase YkuD (ErfK/YbiS/YcfS/YnhG family)
VTGSKIRELTVVATGQTQGTLSWHGSHGDQVVACALGRSGIRESKVEGDGATPVGRFALRRVLYRPDRVAAPVSGLPVIPIDPADGWCDAPDDPAYNRPVRLPYPASHEVLWREDGLYDVIVVMGHNDDPVVPGAGSAVFLHCIRPDGGPTAGCVAIDRTTLIAVLADCDTRTELAIHAP